MNTLPEFIGFPKMARLNREIIVTCKLDGTNGQIHIDDDGVTMLVGSRTRWITPQNDNFGFAAWAEDNKAELLKLGPGSHFGEFWGAGIQRKYGIPYKVFSLFNTERWNVNDPLKQPPACCRVVPVLYRGPFSQAAIEACLTQLREKGSVAAPGFMDPEGVVVYHTAARIGFKITIKDDEKRKGAP